MKISDWKVCSKSSSAILHFTETLVTTGWEVFQQNTALLPNELQFGFVGGDVAECRVCEVCAECLGVSGSLTVLGSDQPLQDT